ncbi:MAG: ComEC/Rec2 family competence protein [Spirochaetota bacterium]
MVLVYLGITSSNTAVLLATSFVCAAVLPPLISLWRARTWCPRFCVVLGLSCLAAAWGATADSVTQPLLTAELWQPVRITGTALDDSYQVDPWTAVYPVSLESITTVDTGKQQADFGTALVYDSSGQYTCWGDVLTMDAPHLTNRNGKIIISARAIERLSSQGSSSFLFRLRRGIIEHIRTSMSRLSPEQKELGQRLLLADADNPNSPLAGLIVDIGCAHLLALSGMHIVVIVAIVQLLFARFLPPRAAAVLTGCTVVMFIFVAGVKASLIRAGIMYSLAVGSRVITAKKLSLSNCVAGALLLQLVFFAESATTLGFRLSYGALTGMLLLAPLFARAFPWWIPHSITISFSSACAAVCMVVPVTAELQGCVHPAAVVGSVLLTPLIFCYMVLMIAICVTSGLPSVVQAIPLSATDLVYKAIVLLSRWLQRWPVFPITAEHLPPLELLLVCAAAVRFMLLYGRMRANEIRKQQYGRDISLRFSPQYSETAR